MQDSRYFTLITLGLLTLAMTACAPYRPASGKAATCNQLNSQVIFTGSTSNGRQADIQRSEEPLAIRNYDKHCEK
jgi:hypothetical protein